MTETFAAGSPSQAPSEPGHMDQAVETPVKVATVRERTSIASQIATVAAVVIPPFGLLSAMGLLWGVAFHWVDLVLLVALYLLTAVGNAVGFHRYFTHKSFETGPVVKASLAILGQCDAGPARSVFT